MYRLSEVLTKKHKRAFWNLWRCLFKIDYETVLNHIFFLPFFIFFAIIQQHQKKYLYIPEAKDCTSNLFTGSVLTRNKGVNGSMCGSYQGTNWWPISVLSLGPVLCWRRCQGIGFLSAVIKTIDYGKSSTPSTDSCSLIRFIPLV